MSENSVPNLHRSQPSKVTAWRKYGPVSLVIGCFALLAVYVTTTTPTNDTTTSVAAPTGVGAESTADIEDLPPGVETYARAKKKGIADEIDWGSRCDTTLGKLALPLWPQADCFKPFTGDNGGSTATGVTEDEITIVLYRTMPNDPVLSFIYAQIGNNDTSESTAATYQGFAEIFNKYYELYGRKVRLVPYVATGNIQDATAATADAETIARDIQPFAVISGPQLTEAFADTLAKNKVLCIACATGQTADWYEERSPYVWDVSRNADQTQQTVAEYLGKRLWNRTAKYAGDPAMHDTTRVFGYIHVLASETAQALEDKFTGQLATEYGMEFAEIQTFSSPLDLPASGKDIITKMKEAGVTTILFSGDPIAPQTLTQIATEQEYFPEWVLGASTLVDTAIFSRTYDQKQWAHAFGPSNLPARSDPEKTGPGFLYRWYFGTEAPAKTSVALIAGPLQVIFAALQGMGPNVTHENFKQVLFRAPIIKSSPISAQVSFGNRGFFPEPDYAGLDDQTEVWWDPNATGIAENGAVGTGMWRYVDGGKRYLPGDWPEAVPRLFDPAGTITIYETAPAGAEVPKYEPLR